MSAGSVSIGRVNDGTKSEDCENESLYIDTLRLDFWPVRVS